MNLISNEPATFLTYNYTNMNLFYVKDCRGKSLKIENFSINGDKLTWYGDMKIHHIHGASNEHDMFTLVLRDDAYYTGLRDDAYYTGYYDFLNTVNTVMISWRGHKYQQSSLLSSMMLKLKYSDEYKPYEMYDFITKEEEYYNKMIVEKISTINFDNICRS